MEPFNQRPIRLMSYWPEPRVRGFCRQEIERMLAEKVSDAPEVEQEAPVVHPQNNNGTLLLPGRLHKVENSDSTKRFSITPDRTSFFDSSRYETVLSTSDASSSYL